MEQIYYCYEKATGTYAGSGITNINTATHACTTTPNTTKLDIWDGSTWVSDVQFSEGPNNTIIVTVNGVVYEFE